MQREVGSPLLSDIGGGRAPPVALNMGDSASIVGPSFDVMAQQLDKALGDLIIPSNNDPSVGMLNYKYLRNGLRLSAEHHALAPPSPPKKSRANTPTRV
jgi:hypothetical protein